MAKNADSEDEFNDGEEGSGTTGADGNKGFGDKVTDVPFIDVDASKLKIKGQRNEASEEEEEEEEEEENEDDDQNGKGLEGQNIDEKDEEEEENNEEEEEEGEGEKKDVKAKGEPEKQAYTVEEFQSSVNKMVSTISKNPSIKTLADIPKVLQENANLKKALENKEIEFPNDRAKLLYEYSVKAAGFETQAAKQYLHIVGLGDVKSLSDKQAQFEAFALSRPDLNRETAQTIFDKKYEAKFTDLENDVLQQDDHAVATREAKEKLGKMQEEFNSSKSEQPGGDNRIDSKVAEAIHKQIDEAIGDDFEGMTIPFGDGDEERLNMKFSNEEEASEFKSFLKEPYKLIEAIADGCLDDNGQVDVEKWIYEMFTIFKRHDLSVEANKLGRTLGQVAIIKGKKSADKGKVHAKNGERGKKLSFEETMLKAVNG